MNKKLTVTLIATLLMTGFALAQEQSSTASAVVASTPSSAAAPTDSCCSAEKKSTCTMEKPCVKDAACEKWTEKKSCHEVLTKEERHQFCAAKAAAIAADPSLAGKGHKKELCEAICKQDPSMKPVMEKLRKHCEEWKKWKKGTASPAS
ncbi:MAG: hypothetical protein ACOYK6_03275 [Chthoniobacterales bacterium]